MLLVEHYVNIGDGKVPLSMAQQAADELLTSQNLEPRNGQIADVPAPPSPPTAAANDAALADLMGKMGGLNLG